MAELPTLGAQCGLPSCRQLDFLPIACPHCERTFCREHVGLDAHGCEKRPEPAQVRGGPEENAILGRERLGHAVCSAASAVGGCVRVRASRTWGVHLFRTGHFDAVTKADPPSDCDRGNIWAVITVVTDDLCSRTSHNGQRIIETVTSRAPRLSGGGCCPSHPGRRAMDHFGTG